MENLLKNLYRGILSLGSRLAFIAAAALALALAVGANNAALKIPDFVPIHPPALEYQNVKTAVQAKSRFEETRLDTEADSDCWDSKPSPGVQSKFPVRDINIRGLLQTGLAIPGR